MIDNKAIESIAKTLISQYGDDAETVAMLRAAEHAAEPVSYTHLRAHET